MSRIRHILRTSETEVFNQIHGIDPMHFTTQTQSHGENMYTPKEDMNESTKCIQSLKNHAQCRYEIIYQMHTRTG